MRDYYSNIRFYSDFLCKTIILYGLVFTDLINILNNSFTGFLVGFTEFQILVYRLISIDVLNQSKYSFECCFDPTHNCHEHTSILLFRILRQSATAISIIVKKKGLSTVHMQNK